MTARVFEATSPVFVGGTVSRRGKVANERANMDRMTTVGSVDMAPVLNGTPRRHRSRKSKPAAVSAPGARGRARRAIMVGMGCGVPCLSLALSSIDGRLCLDGHYGLGTAV